MPPIQNVCVRFPTLPPCSIIVASWRCSPRLPWPWWARGSVRICEELAVAGLTIVSGMAYGIDRQAHLGGMAGVGSSVAVLGSGLDRVYPETNADLYRALCDKGLVVTEYAPGTLPEARNLPVRNRIIAGLALGVWVVEAAPGSGSLITARLGMEHGREIFALPGRIDDPTFTGCNELIGQGAHPVSGAECVLRTLRYQLSHLLEAPAARAAEPGGVAPLPQEPVATPPPDPDDPHASGDHEAPVVSLDTDAAALLAMLEGRDRLHIDAITQRLDRPSGSVCALLLELEVKGLVRQWPGMYYSRPD